MPKSDLCLTSNYNLNRVHTRAVPYGMLMDRMHTNLNPQRLHRDNTSAVPGDALMCEIHKNLASLRLDRANSKPRIATALVSNKTMCHGAFPLKE